MTSDERRSDQRFLYDAFISYRHVERDRQWAEWLIHALESYRVPKALRQRGLPPRLRKVFRDEDEVPASSDLNDQIREALIASRFLIVICSAFTPRSKWVEREIEIFNDLGRGDQVLALLTEGEPGDSFPSAMLVRKRQVDGADGTTQIVKEDKEPLAADVRPRKGQSVEKLKRFALLRLIAVILGVKFDDLRQRDQERERHGRLALGTAAAAVLLLAGGASLLYWNVTRPSTAHYRQIVWRWGVPEGLGAVAGDMRAHLATSYGVTVQRSNIFASPRVVEVRRENSAGTLRATDSLRIDNDGRARWVVRYRDDGSVDRIESFDASDRLLSEDMLRREGSTNKFIVSYERHNIPIARDAHVSRIVDPLKAGQRDLLEGRTEITREVLTLDANGFVAERRYEDSWGTPRHDAQGSFGEHITNSPEGLVLRRADIDADGAEVTLKSGVRANVLAYDHDYALARYTLVGPDGRPIVGPNGFAYYERQSDRWGNDVATGYYDADGKATLHKDGYARYTVAYDDRGFQTILAYFGLDGQPALTKDGYASFRRICDDRGYPIEEDYFGIDGQPTVIKNGFATTKIAYDERGHIIEKAFFDISGNPATEPYGEAILRQTFDSRGNLTAKFFFGIDGKLTPIKDGYSIGKMTFDDRDNIIETKFLDVNGMPTLNKFGVAKITASYDARGNLHRFAVFGVDDKPALWKGYGAAVLELEHDTHGNITEERDFGVDGKLTLTSYGTAGYQAEFDDRGNLIEKTNIGADGKPQADNDHVVTYRYRYDARGNAIEGTHTDVEGKPAMSLTGDVSWRNVYDERGNRIELAYFDFDGKPMLTRERVAKIRYVYDVRGNEIERDFFGVDGKPTLISTGIAGFRQNFDVRGNKIEVDYFGVDGKPTLSSEGIATFRYNFDARGNEIERRFFGVDGKPILGSYGFAGVTSRYDARGYAIEGSYFGADGKPIMIPKSGYSKVVWARDARGDLVEESFFDVDGAPVSGGACAKITYVYDNVGRETGVTCFDALNREVQIEVAISKVSPGFNGARAGLAPADRILTYNSQKVTSIRRLYDLVNEPGPPYRIVTVRRGAQIVSFSVQSGSLGIDLVVVQANPPEANAAGAGGN